MVVHVSRFLSLRTLPPVRLDKKPHAGSAYFRAMLSADLDEKNMLQTYDLH